MTMPRWFEEVHIDEDFPEVPQPTDRGEFYDCTFHKLRDAKLTRCCLRGRKLVMTEPRDVMGVTVSMDCFTFLNLELSPEVLDMFLLLLCKTSGNTQKRKDIVEKIVGRERAIKLLKQMHADGMAWQEGRL